MPVYTFRCPQCDKVADHVLPVDLRYTQQVCPSCGNDDCTRDLTAEAVHSTDQEYHTPVYSNALGINPAQIPDALKRFPHHEYAPDGRMILRSHAQRKRVMKELGFFDKDGY